VHLALIGLNYLGIFGSNSIDLLSDPIVAIYTPFSFILVYEVYLLIYFLPASITQYIAKQYEIITLIVIRRIFKDISDLELTANWFQNKESLQFTYDIFTTLLLFALLFVFYLLMKKAWRPQIKAPDAALSQFIAIKKHLSVLLVPVFLILALFSFGTWVMDIVQFDSELSAPEGNLNNVFFDDFFTVLILADVLLLLFSFVHRQSFAKVIRNSGFIISTVMLKLSFSTTGLLNISLIVGAVFFGVCILFLYNQYERLSLDADLPTT
jgi:NADH:ubiquinone oxidoreductase subunit 6 (subunit J)